MTFNKAKDQEIQGNVASDFDEFDVDMDTEFQESSDTKSIPYAQIVTADIDRTRFSSVNDGVDQPYGLFIPLTQAEKAGFTPDENWMIEYPVLGSKVKKFGGEDSTAGYFVKPGAMCRMVILATSQQEVYCDKIFNGKKSKACLGPYLEGWKDGQPIKSEAGHQFDSAPKNQGWQNSERYLLYIVGEDNAPLSERPFSLRISNAFGIGFKSELKLNSIEMAAASKTHFEMMKVKAVAVAEAAKAAAVASGDVEAGITADAQLKAAKRKATRSLSYKDSSRFVFVFNQSMRENADGIGTVFVSGRAQPAIWQGERPAPFHVDRTKKNGDLIYSIAITPTAYPSLFVKAASDFGEQIATDLVTYASFKIAPNLRKTLATTPETTTAPMPDFDPKAEPDYTYEYQVEPEANEGGLENDEAFSRILVQLARAVDTDQIEKWLVWALKPSQMGPFKEDYPNYADDLVALGAKHAKTLASS